MQNKFWILIFCATLVHADDTPLAIEIISQSHTYLSKTSATQITLKTNATALYEIRSGTNCRNSESLAAGKYNGVAKENENKILVVAATDLREGHNSLVACFNRELLVNSSSQNLDYQKNVYEKHFMIIVDSQSPEINIALAQVDDETRTIQVLCADNFGCEKISYVFDANDPARGTHISGQTLALPLSDSKMPKLIAVRAEDRAGNFSQIKTLVLDADDGLPFGNARIIAMPGYFFRLDSRRDKTPQGISIVLAADFAIHTLIGLKYSKWLPGLRFDGQLTTYGNGSDTTDVTGLHLGPIWLLPLWSKNWHLAFGTTWGVAKSLAIYADNSIVAATALSGGAFAGLEYTWRKLVFSVSARGSYLVSNLDPVMGVGIGLGVGIKF